jgi:hypothetical protein
MATWIGGLIFFLSPPLMGVVVKTAFAQRITVWAQHHP